MFFFLHTYNFNVFLFFGKVTSLKCLKILYDLFLWTFGSILFYLKFQFKKKKSENGEFKCILLKMLTFADFEHSGLIEKEIWNIIKSK